MNTINRNLLVSFLSHTYVMYDIAMYLAFKWDTKKARAEILEVINQAFGYVNRHDLKKLYPEFAEAVDVLEQIHRDYGNIAGQKFWENLVEKINGIFEQKQVPENVEVRRFNISD